MWRREQVRCEGSGAGCDFHVAHGMIYNSPDGKMFRVRRLVCVKCGERVMEAKREAPFVPPAWQRDGAVEANF